MPKEVLVNQTFEKYLIKELYSFKLMYPLKGTKRKLLNIAIENAKINLKNSLNNIKQKERITIEANNKLSELLNIKIKKIESFDNSHLFGEHYVGAMVVFINGLPVKKEYRKFNLKVNKIDDTAAMKEVVYRRYTQALVNNEVLPDLIIVDGGKPQINIIKKELHNLNLNIKVIGLVKNKNHVTEKIIDGDNLDIINIDDDNLYLYLKHIQDETHRFVINHHRNLKNKFNSKSILDDVKGIGEKRKLLLLKKFKNVENIQKASDNELSKILPKSVIINLRKRLQEKSDKVI
jgi:excinuclease ABC subunit C